MHVSTLAPVGYAIDGARAIGCRDGMARDARFYPARVSYRIILDPPVFRTSSRPMYRLLAPHISENELYLKLFITNGGGW